jgi:uncharacterized protein (DUF1330 family)
MDVKNSVYPSKEQFEGLQEEGVEGAIYMVNLLKFKDKAEYADGRETDLTGEEAYGLYSQGVQELLKKHGGAITFAAPITGLRLGEVEELWNTIAIAMYPSRQAMREMMMSPEMTEISEHRAAGLEGQLNIEAADAQGLWLESK